MDDTLLPQLNINAARARLLDEETLLRTLLGSVLPVIRPACEKIVRDVTEGRHHEARVDSHSLRGALASAGAERLVHHLRRLEQTLNTGLFSDSLALLPVITSESSEVERLIRLYLESAPAPANQEAPPLP